MILNISATEKILKYTTLKRWNNMDEAVHGTEDYLADVSTWMENNLLKSNRNKTELIVFSSKQNVKKTRNFHLKVQLHRICKIGKESCHYLR